MPHLSPERIAALVDEPATGSERAHFEQCARCRADFVAMRRIVDAAGAERERPIAPLVPWPQLAGALRDEGLVSGPPASLTVSSAPVAVRPIMSAPSLSQVRGDGRGPRVAPWMRMLGMAAAAGLLVTAGVVGGRMSVARGAASGASLATSIPVANVAQFRSSDDARATLRSAEQVYSGALLWLAAHDSALAPRAQTGSEAAAMNYRERLEVLDAAMATARRALYEAPDDPVMNRYYLATLGAREVTLRRLTTVLPASQQVLEY